MNYLFIRIFLYIQYFLCVFKDWVGAHAEEKHGEEEEQNVNSNNKFADMFEMPPTTFSFKDADTNSWRSIMEDHIAHIEMNMSHL